MLTVEFTVAGIPCLGMNGGPGVPHSMAFSFQIATDDQAETDRLWNAIIHNGGEASACGWCKDKWGLSWQITPRALSAAITDPDRAAAKRAFNAMMEMTKIDIAAIERRDGGDAGQTGSGSDGSRCTFSAQGTCELKKALLVGNCSSSLWNRARAMCSSPR